MGVRYTSELLRCVVKNEIHADLFLHYFLLHGLLLLDVNIEEFEPFHAWNKVLACAVVEIDFLKHKCVYPKNGGFQKSAYG